MFIVSLIHSVQKLMKARAIERELALLDDNVLADIGIVRSAIRFEARKLID